METMGNQMDELDGAITQLMDQAGLEPPPESDANAVKPTPKFEPLSNLDKSADSRAVLWMDSPILV